MKISLSGCTNLLGNLCKNIAFAKYLNFFAINFNIAASVATVNNFIAFADRNRCPLAIFTKIAWSNCKDSSSLGFLSCSIGKQNPACALVFSF